MHTNELNTQREQELEEDVLTEAKIMGGINGSAIATRMGEFARTEFGRSTIGGIGGTAAGVGMYEAGQSDYTRRHHNEKPT
jgi:hypothetical protein